VRRTTGKNKGIDISNLLPTLLPIPAIWARFALKLAWYTRRVFIFIIPLLHPQNATSWDHVLDLLERTLKSVSNQTASEFKVILVYNEGSRLRSYHPGVIYHPINLPPNPLYELGSSTEQGRNSFRLDKGKKCLAGLYRAREFSNPQSPAYVMFVDADDCVSSRMVEFASHSSQSNGWFVDQGYLYKEGGHLMYHLQTNFSRLCGTCHVIRYDLFDLPLQMEAVSQEYILRGLGSHIFIREMLAEKGTPLDPLPFAGAVYVFGHGDNHSQTPGYRSLILGRSRKSKGFSKTLRMLSHFRLQTNSLRREFGLYPIKYPDQP
jgi:hypothetical protein